MEKTDVTIIGSGPGGYVAGIRASQLGKKVVIIEEEKMGGICLNWGCIPTKALLKNAEVLNVIKNASKFGVKVSDYKIDWEKIINRSRNVTKRLSKGIEYLMKKNNIQIIKGRGKLIENNIIEIEKSDKSIQNIQSQHCIIATGARAKSMSNIIPNGNQIITYKEAMILDNQPKKMIIIGAGAIGVEFAHFFNTFGTEVILIEALPYILPNEDIEISEALKKILIKRKIKIFTDSTVKEIKTLKSKVKIILTDGKTIEAEKVLMAIGVKGNIENIGLQKLGIELENGWIATNGYMQTNIPNIYAIGDVAGPPWLAHVASTEGIKAAEHLSGTDCDKMKYDNIPGCTYSHPEVASVGYTEKSAIEAGYSVRIGKFPFRALGKALATEETEGFVKIIYDATYGEMLGCHIIGSEATNLITESVIARNLETTYQEVLNTIHPHPTLSEAIMEATADAYEEGIHI